LFQLVVAVTATMKNKVVCVVYRSVNSSINYHNIHKWKDNVCVELSIHMHAYMYTYSHISIDYASTQHYGRDMAISRGNLN